MYAALNPPSAQERAKAAFEPQFTRRTLARVVQEPHLNRKNVQAELTKNKEAAADQLLADGVNEYYSVRLQ